jgi:hypothetical protein
MSLDRSIPIESEWRSESWNIDVDSAFEHFGGKSKEEAMQLFQKDAARYQEDLLYTPTACFPYYLDACMTYLRSRAADGDAEGAAGFISLITDRAREYPDEVRDLWPEIFPTLRHIAVNQEHYGADEENFGSFHEQIESLSWLGLSVDEMESEEYEYEIEEEENEDGD